MILTKHGFLYDIVYLVKPDRVNEELRYSLRTVEKNFPHNSVWFYGGCPDGIQPDHHYYIHQEDINGPKWVKTTTMLRKACENERLTEWIWLFNDDFFVIDPAPEAFEAIYHGTIENRIEEIETERGGLRSQYSSLMRQTQKLLERAGMETLNYATHTPLLINRACALETMEMFPRFPMFRNLYGNMWELHGIDKPDVKINDMESIWNGRDWCVSTNDETFKNGRIGEYIRALFPEPSRWEATK
jgi:hypothetical protein